MMTSPDDIVVHLHDVIVAVYIAEKSSRLTWLAAEPAE